MLEMGERPGAVEMGYRLAHKVFPISSHYYERDFKKQRRVMITAVEGMAVWAQQHRDGKLAFWFPHQNKTKAVDFDSVCKDYEKEGRVDK